MTKHLLVISSIVLSFTIGVSKVLDQKFDSFSKTVQCEFKRTSKENLIYFLETGDLVLNYTNIEEDMISLISQYGNEASYKFTYEGDYGYAYPKYVKTINLQYRLRNGFRLDTKTIFVSIEENNNERKNTLA